MSARDLLDAALDRPDTRETALIELMAAVREWAQVERDTIEANRQDFHTNQKFGRLAVRRENAARRLLAAADLVEQYG